MKKIFRFFLFVLILGVFSCSSSMDMKNRSSKLSYLDKEFLKIDTTAGQHNIILKTKKNKEWKLSVCFPELEVKKKVPLIIALHWAGEGTVYQEFSKCLIEPGFANMDAIIVSPYAERLLWFDAQNEEKILKLIELAKRHWNVDPNKIIVTGYSNGGNGSWYFAEKYPKIIRAAIPMASAYAVQSKIEVPLYVIHGEKDELFDVNKIREEVNMAAAKGAQIKLSVNPEFSHYMACAYVDELRKAVTWLQTQLKKQ